MNTRRSEPVSYGYVKISESKAKQLVGAWLNKSLPKSQWQIVAPIMKRKVVPDVAEPVIRILRNLGIDKLKLLDVGCSSGYYYDFFKWALLNVKYSGCDVSPDFISLAKKRYWGVDFRVATITDLPYKGNGFEIVFASGVLHSELNYRQAIKEIARVSSRYILLHRLPIFSINTNIGHYQKMGYGVIMMETVFPLSKLTELFDDLKLKMKFCTYGDRMDIKTPAYWTTVLLEKTN